MNKKLYIQVSLDYISIFVTKSKKVILMVGTNISQMEETVFMEVLWNGQQTRMSADTQLRRGEAALHEAKRELVYHLWSGGGGRGGEGIGQHLKLQIDT